MDSVFSFHLKEETVRRLMRDPLLNNEPTFAEIRGALLRLDEEDKGDEQCDR